MSKTFFRALLIVAAFGAAPARAEVPTVVADIAPVHALVVRVMAGVGAPALLLPPGASPHGYALRPSQAAALSGADLVIWVGPALTPWLERPLGNLAEGAAVLTLAQVPGLTLHGFREADQFDQAEAVHDHDDHDPLSTDPHIWLDPANAARWLAAIAEALAQADPDNAAAYRTNAADGQDEMEALEAQIAARMAPLHDLRYIVFHDAYQYFEARFGLRATGAIALSDGARPGPARLARLRDAVARAHVTCALAEPQFDPGVLDAVAEGAALRIGIIDPLGTTLTPGADLYPALIRAMAMAFEDCA